MTALLTDEAFAATRPAHRADRSAGSARVTAAPGRKAAWAHQPRPQVHEAELAAVLPLRPRQAAPNDLDLGAIVRAALALQAADPSALNSPDYETVTAIPRLDAPRYSWTPRGLAVLLGLIALVVGAMTVTVITAFLAVDPTPVASAVPAQAAAVSAPLAAQPAGR